ncbi:uncharacterized protein FYN12_004614 isoform 2-T2 [Phoenicopterus ruber ruber]
MGSVRHQLSKYQREYVSVCRSEIKNVSRSWSEVDVKPSGAQCVGQGDQPWLLLPRGLPPALPGRGAHTGLPSSSGLNGPDAKIRDNSSLALTLESFILIRKKSQSCFRRAEVLVKRRVGNMGATLLKRTVYFQSKHQRGEKTASSNARSYGRSRCVNQEGGAVLVAEAQHPTAEGALDRSRGLVSSGLSFHTCSSVV